jgi:predicted permease
MKYALRSLGRSPGFTVVALLTLALGIGVNTSMFSVLDTLLFHTPVYPQSERLVRIFRTSRNLQTGPHSPADFLDYHGQARSLEHLSAFMWSSFNSADPGQPAERLPGMLVSGDYFAALGVEPALGRFITAEEDQPGHNNVVVISDGLWRRKFSADPDVIGREIRLDGERVTVIGVMPARFDDPLLWDRIEAWRPLAFDDGTRTVRGGNWLHLIARLAPGATLAQAQAELSALAADHATRYPETNAGAGLNLLPLARSFQSGPMQTLPWFAMGLAGCVLLIACANLANLQFARNSARARDYAVRAALGASRVRLIRESLAESVPLALAGGGLGLLVALWGNDLLGSRLGIGGDAGLSLPLSWPVLAFAFAAATASGIAFGLLPGLLAARTDVNDTLKQGSRTTGAGSHHRLRQALIVVEVALALVLLSGAGFFLRGLDRFAARDHGWRTDHLLTASLALPESKYGEDPAQVAFYERLETRLSALPGVEHVALSRSVPFGGFNFGQRLIVEGRPLPKPGAELVRDVNGVSPDFFATMGMVLREGRTFTAADRIGPTRTIINEAMARQLWPGESAIGKHIAHPIEREWQEVIGVVSDVSFPTNLNTPRTPFQTYRLLAREPARYIALELRTSADPSAMVNAVRRAVAELDPELPVQGLGSASDTVERGLANYHTLAWLLAGFAALGLLLAALGIYGVISGFVAQRTSEIGLRMALGAQVRHVLRLVFGQSLRLALLGATIGLGGAYAVARLLASMMPALPAAEPVTAAAVTFFLITIALLACWLPARRATKVDPMIALRAE